MLKENGILKSGTSSFQNFMADIRNDHLDNPAGNQNKKQKQSYPFRRVQSVLDHLLEQGWQTIA